MGNLVSPIEGSNRKYSEFSIKNYLRLDRKGMENLLASLDFLCKIKICLMKQPITLTGRLVWNPFLVVATISIYLVMGFIVHSLLPSIAT